MRSAAILLLGLAGRGLVAQNLDTAQLRHRADSLLRLWREANTFARVQVSLDDARRQGTARATRATAAIRSERPVQRGGLMVIASEPDSIPLQETVPRTWAALRATYGSRADSLASQPVHIIVINSEREPVVEARARRVPAHIAPDLLERTLLGLIGSPRADGRLSRWLGGAVHVLLDTARARSETYMQLVTGGVAARACFRGDLNRCADALELPEDSTFYLTTFNAAERREAVARARQPDVLEQVPRAQYTQCVNHADDSACVHFLQALGRDQVPRPLDGNARDALVFTALAMGGDSAYDRLVQDTTAPVVKRLEHAARAPVAAIVSRWRHDVLAARPSSPSVPLRETVFALGWVGLLTAGAVRSSRWRLG